MKFTITKANYITCTVAKSAKVNLLDVCKWFNFIEDDMHVQFPDDHITLRIAFDYFIANPSNYMNNGVFGVHSWTNHLKLPTHDNWESYCLFASNKIPVQFVYINKHADIFSGFEFGVQLDRDLEWMEIDTRTYDGC